MEWLRADQGPRGEDSALPNESLGDNEPPVDE